MSGVQILEIGQEEGEQRLDRFLKRKFPSLSQGMIEKMCRKGELRLDGGRVKSNTRVEAGQSLRVPPLPDAPVAPYVKKSGVSDKDAEWVQSLVIYRDPDILVLNKPHGIAVQGGSKTTRHIDGLAEALMFNRDTKPHLVHRLDRDTSGVLVMGRHPQAAAKLSKLFQSRFIEKVYWAAVAGQPQKQGRIRFGLRKAGGHGANGEGEKMQTVHPSDMKDTRDAKSALTDFILMESAGGRLSWLAMSPRTGRTHQLRAHAQAMGNPIIGDGKYGGSGQENRGDGWGAGIGGDVSKKLHLHARSLSFEHPMRKQKFFISAELPEHMKSTWDLLGWEAGREADIRWEEETSRLKK